MANYTEPNFKSSSFNCPHCGAYAKQHWTDLEYYNGGAYQNTGVMKMAICDHCNDVSFWYKKNMIVPDVGGVELPNLDLPEDIQSDYNEARAILSRSPRGSAALLRLAIQKLCAYLGETGGNINSDIAALVKKGLPVKVQRSLDILRVVGNNAVHPGQLDLTDNYELATHLFGLINVIAEVMITQPKHIESLYSDLPEHLVKAIENRDKK